MTHNRSMHDARDPWRASLRASHERRAAARRARRWTFRRRGVAAAAAAVMALGGGAARPPAPPRRWTCRRRGVAACAAAVMALGGGAAVAGNGGTTPSQSDENASASSVTLKPGSRGSNVKRLQRKLRVQVSGYYG